VKGKGESKSGYYSSHGVMVPMGPAFSSDGSKYLGRPRRPRYAGSSGSPSMHADSGFSSIDGLGRVNKGYEEDVKMLPMFPGQSDDDFDEEDDIVAFLRTRKLPVYSIGIHPKFEESGLKTFNEGFIPDFVSDFFKSAGLSVPGIDILIGKMILDREAERGKVAIDNLCSGIGVSVNELSASLIDPNDDPMILIIQRVCELSDNDRLDARDYFREFLKALKDSIVTLVQAYDSLAVVVAGQLGPQAATPEELVTVPATNFISGLAGFFTRALPVERLVFNLSSRLARMLIGTMEISDTLEKASPRYKEAIDRFESGFGPIFSAIRSKPALSLSRLGTLYAALNGDKSLCIVEELPKTEEAESEITVDEEELDQDDDYVETVGAELSYESNSLEFPEAAGCACPVSEAMFVLLENRYNSIARRLEMPKSTLRAFVREMIREAAEDEISEDNPSRYGGRGYLPSDVLPYGQSYIDADERDMWEDVKDEYAVTYKGDEDFTGYSARSTAESELKEAALRRIIRTEAKRILDSDNDSKKKKDTKDDDLDEFSGASAGGGGPATPVGTGPDGRDSSGKAARQRAIDANRRFFGGGKSSDSWMVYPTKGY